MEPKIPARLIQTGRNCDLPIRARAAVTGLKVLNPDFEYCFFDNAQVAAFVKNEFPEYLDIFENFRIPIQKYDFFRYLAVFKYGGFYFDTDVFFARGLGDLLAHECVFPFEELTLSRYLRREHQIDWEIGNYGFGASAGHPFLAAVIENCVKAQREPNWIKPMMQPIPRCFRSEYYVLNTTGPGLVTRTLAENPQLANRVTILFPEDVCDEYTWHQFGDFGIHAMEGSWRFKSGYLKRRLANLWEARTRLRLFTESRSLGKTRSLVEKTNVQPLTGSRPVALSCQQ